MTCSDSPPLRVEVATALRSRWLFDQHAVAIHCDPHGHRGFEGLKLGLQLQQEKWKQTPNPTKLKWGGVRGLSISRGSEVLTLEENWGPVASGVGDGRVPQCQLCRVQSHLPWFELQSVQFVYAAPRDLREASPREVGWGGESVPALHGVPGRAREGRGPSGESWSLQTLHWL